MKINKKIIITLFVLVALIQLYAPAKMIWDREDVIHTGNDFKFKTAPLDPNDPFRGKYVTLRFDESIVEVDNPKDWVRGDMVYALIVTDSTGFAKVEAVSKSKITDSKDYIKAKVKWVSGNQLKITYPFRRYYMEESKAYDAELEYLKSRLNPDVVSYALVSIKDGGFVIKDVFIGDDSIIDVVKARQQKEN